jgi:hypothetical protein
MQNPDLTTKSGWKRRHTYLQTVGIAAPFLADFDRFEKHQLLECFSGAIQEGRFSTERCDRLASDTVRATVDHVAQTSMEHDHPNPRHDESNQLAFILSKQYKGYHSVYPGETRQKALTASIIRQTSLLTKSQLQIAILQLIGGAFFFFAMRSYKYCKVPGKLCTKIIWSTMI